jgi:HD-like signal output (HDOD) protein
VNSAQYARAGNISTVSRAVTLVGFNGIRNMALSLVLLEHMQDKAHAGQLKEEFLRSLMAGSIGGELCPVLKESEEAFIGSMFQDLGRLLAQFYFAEEAGRIRSMVNSQREPVSERAASVSVLGLSYEDLGVGVAKAWGLPTGFNVAWSNLLERLRYKPHRTSQSAYAGFHLPPMKSLMYCCTVILKRQRVGLLTLPGSTRRSWEAALRQCKLQR